MKTPCKPYLSDNHSTFSQQMIQLTALQLHSKMVICHFLELLKSSCMLNITWKDNILLILSLHDFAKKQSCELNLSMRKNCRDTGEVPFTVNLELG